MLDKGFGEFTQLVALSLREVISFTFAEKCQQIDWYVGIVIVVNNANTTSFPHAFSCPAELSDAARLRYHRAGLSALVGKPTEPFVTP